MTPPVLTPQRVRLAYGIAVTADLLQLLLGPLGWAGADELIDVVTMVLIWRAVGFHPVLLPTFALEFLPIADWLPTWTGCGDGRRAPQAKSARDAPPDDPGPFIDV
jgi:hypothetical protein